MTEKEFDNRKPGDRIRYIGGPFDMELICLPSGYLRITKTGPRHIIGKKVSDTVDVSQTERMTWIKEFIDSPNTFKAKNGKEITCEVKHAF